MSNRFHVATRKGLFTVSRTNGSWSISDPAFIGTPVPMVLHDPRDAAEYATVSHGHFGNKLHRRDADEDWREITTPAYPPKPDGVPAIIDPVRQKEIPWSLEMIWALEPDPRSDGALWCGTIPGGLFHSPDRGESWRLVEPLWNHVDRAKWMGGGYDYPGIHSICVDPRNADRVLLGVSCGGAWVTDDAGATWRQTAHGMRADYLPPEEALQPDTQDPHRIAQCPAQPDKLWAQHHNGIFKSTDSGTSWTEVEQAGPSTFGFAVAVHPDDGDTAWFVPGVKDETRVPVDGQLVVTRTTDGGQSFDVLRAGLPQQHAYDIVYRHALAVDATGQRLVMGTTTGNLFITDDAGDSWQTISHHLPPVYAVRFV